MRKNIFLDMNGKQKFLVEPYPNVKVIYWNMYC